MSTLPQLTDNHPPGFAGRLVGVEQACLAAAGRPILDHVDLDIHRGEIVTLIGPNGSGKTTLVKVILGIQALDSGRRIAAPGMRIGYVPQNLEVPATLPMTAARFLALRRRASRSDIAEALFSARVGQLIDQPLKSVSGGEFRRILLARALLDKPDLLVLDEPTAGMDVHGQNELYRIIGELGEQHGCAVLLVSHDLHLVMASTARVVCLNHHVCCEGQPEVVSRNPDYLRLFGYHDGDQIAVYRHHHDHHHDLAGAAVEPTDRH